MNERERRTISGFTVALIVGAVLLAAAGCANPAMVTIRVLHPSGDNCAGQTGHNFGPCEGWQRVSAEFQAGDGGGSTADAPAAAESAAAPGPGPGGNCK